MSYNHLTTFERGRIQELLSLGYSHRVIAKKLSRHRSCIDREIRRNSFSADYIAEAAQASYDIRHQFSKPKGKVTDELITLITEKL